MNGMKLMINDKQSSRFHYHYYLMDAPTIGIPSSTSFCNFIFKIPVMSPTTRGGKDSYTDITVRLFEIGGVYNRVRYIISPVERVPSDLE